MSREDLKVFITDKKQFFVKQIICCKILASTLQWALYHHDFVNLTEEDITKEVTERGKLSGISLDDLQKMSEVSFINLFKKLEEIKMCCKKLNKGS